MKTQSVHVSECVMEDYAIGGQCVAVANWRADVRNAGGVASIDEVRRLINAAPARLVKHGHGTDMDRAEFALLVRAAVAGVPASELEIASA